ncbi:MAG: hypothetical protein HY291_16315 [Planctomycetes bacterium]|nr:hypothetical protein [Planctomycetota bacterium]
MNAPKMELPAARPLNVMRLDGRGVDPVWARAAALPEFKRAGGKNEPPESATRGSVLRAGRWLLVRLEAVESEGYIAREGIHGGDPWFEDELGIEVKGPRTLHVYVNPLGTVWCQLDEKASLEPFYNKEILASARIGERGWSAEFAVDLTALELPQALHEVGLRAVRQRQQRGTTSYRETWTTAKDAPLALKLGDGWSDDLLARVEAAPPEPLAGRATLPAGRCEQLPAEGDAWRRMPAALLRDGTGLSPVDPDFQATSLRAAATGGELALRIFCHEAFPDSIENPGTALWKEDNVELFLGPEGYPYLHVSAGPLGKVEAAAGKTGGRNIRGIPVPEGIKVEAKREDGGWSARVRIPFATVQKTLGLPAGLQPDVFPWRIQVSRNRPSRAALGQAQQYSVLAVTNSATAHCPLRFAVLRLQVPFENPADEPALPSGGLPKPVLTADERKQLKANELVSNWAAARRDRMHKEWLAAFEKLDGAEAWKAFAAKARTELLANLFPATGGKPPERTPLNARTIYEREGDGFRVVGLIFEPRPGLPEPATLFLPKEKAKEGEKRAALVVIPAHHTPRHGPDLYAVGANLARAGGVAMLFDTLGSGECSVVARWEHKSYQRNEIGVQMTLAGDDAAGWIAWEISRAADVLLERGDIDPARLGVLGGVAGGGDLASVAAAFDERFTLCVPFNFSGCAPFGGYYDPPRALRGSQPAGLSPWMVDALVAPRRLIQAQEFTWSDACKDSYVRFEKVYGWLGKPADLSFLHGGDQTHATHFAGLHRIPMYKILNGWWNLALPETEKSEARPAFNSGELECFTNEEGGKRLDALRAAGVLKEPFQFAQADARERLAAARAKRIAAKTTVREVLERICGPLAPEDAGKVAERQLGLVSNASVLGYWLPAEKAEAGAASPVPGIAVWLLVPGGLAHPRPLVVGVAQAGKARFLAERGSEIERLLKADTAVALVDVRGCGETSAGPSRSPESESGDLASLLWLQKDSLPARQIKDLRTALAFLAKLEHVDASRVALWGEGFTEPNGSCGTPIRFDETGFRQSGPVPMNLVEPLGGWLALAGALFEFEDPEGKAHRPKAVLARGTLHAYLSVLERRYHYLPMDAAIPDLLSELDVADVAAELKSLGVGVAVEDLRDGSNRSVDGKTLGESWGEAVPEDYAPTPSARGFSAFLDALKK